MSNVLTKQLSALESSLVPLFAKAPHLPEHSRKTLANAAPWVALVFGILGIFGVISMGGVGLVFSIWISWAGSAIPFLIGIVIGLISSILDLCAFAPLRKMHKHGWNLLFYGAMLSILSTLIHMAVGYGSLLGLLMAIVGLWLLFEIRGLYR